MQSVEQPFQILSLLHYRGWTTVRLAHELGVSQRLVSYVIHGERGTHGGEKSQIVREKIEEILALARIGLTEGKQDES